MNSRSKLFSKELVIRLDDANNHIQNEIREDVPKPIQNGISEDTYSPLLNGIKEENPSDIVSTSTKELFIKCEKLKVKGDEIFVSFPRVKLEKVDVPKKTRRRKSGSPFLKEASFSCDYCDKLFFKKKEVRRHIINHMNNTSLIKCDLCGIGFARRTYLSEHNCIHNGQKPHVCYYCNKPFSLRCNLIRHVRIHTGEKRFSCDQCKKSFILKKNLIEHRRVHTGEKPFKCNICDWSFSRRSSLVRHARIHTGEKKYKCHCCNKSFAWKYYLQRHMNVHLGGSRRNSNETSESIA